MMGAFFSWMLLRWLGVGYFPALVIVPLMVGIVGMVIERLLLRRIYRLDHMYGLLLTFGILTFIQGLFVWLFATAGRPYPVPAELRGGFDLGFMFLPAYRAWVVAASLAFCLTTWLVIEKTPLGRTLRAATENPSLTRAFGVNVPALMTFGFGVGVALAGAAGLLAAPIYSVSPLMGGDLVIVVFAVVVIGGMGSILGSIVTSLSLGLLEGLARVVYPQGANMVIFVIMIAVLLVRPAGLFGRER
jgi:branched-chain amino acid transport system permease protein